MTSTEMMIPTGEVLDVSKMPDAATALDALREMKHQINEQIHFIEQVVGEEMARTGSQTINVGRVALVRKVTKDYDWDLEELAKLEDLGLPRERLEQLIVPVYDTKVKLNVAREIAAASPAYKQVIEDARVVKGERISVTVKHI